MLVTTRTRQNLHVFEPFNASIIWYLALNQFKGARCCCFIGSLMLHETFNVFSVRYFENELWYIEHVIVCLQDVMEHVFICQEIFVKEEVRKICFEDKDLLNLTT